MNKMLEDTLYTVVLYCQKYNTIEFCLSSEEMKNSSEYSEEKVQKLKRNLEELISYGCLTPGYKLGVMNINGDIRVYITSKGESYFQDNESDKHINLKKDILNALSLSSNIVSSAMAVTSFLLALGQL